MVSLQLKVYEEDLGKLEAILNEGKWFWRTAKAGEIESAYGNLLNTRDTLQSEIMRVTDIKGEQLVTIAKLDARLRIAGLRTLRRHYINMRFWRKVRMPDDQEHWWWELDKELYGIQKRYRSPIRSSIYTALALVIIVLNINFIVQTGSTIATWFLNIFSRVNAQQYGLDVITVVAVAAQIAFSGGIAARITKRLTKIINRFIARSYDVIRPITLLLVPVSSFFVGTIIFVLIIWSIDAILPTLSDRLRDSIINVEQPLTSAESVLATSALLDPDIDASIDLTRLGIQNQDIGNGERARSLFEQAISSAPNLIVADYRLANIYVDTDVKDRAAQLQGIRVVDRSLRPIDRFQNLLLEDLSPEELKKEQDNLLHDMRLVNESYVYQFNVLLLITRARAFMNLGEPAAALVDLTDAEQVVKAHPELFVLGEQPASEEPVSEEATPEAPVIQVANPVRLPELYYLTAKAYDQRYASTNSLGYKTRADNYWRLFSQVVERRLGTERLWALEAQARLPN